MPLPQSNTYKKAPTSESKPVHTGVSARKSRYERERERDRQTDRERQTERDRDPRNRIQFNAIF